MGTGYIRQSASNITSGQPITSAPVNNEFNQIVGFASGSSGHAHDGSTGNGPQLTVASLGALTGSSTGILSAISATSFSAVTITGTSGQITLTNGNGVAGNPTISLPTNVTTGSFTPNSAVTPTLGLYNPPADNLTSGISSNSALVALFNGASSAVDYFTFSNSATGSPASITIGATGTDTNINIDLLPKGTGYVGIGSSLLVTGQTVTGTLSSTGAAVLQSTLAVTGNTTVGGTLGVTGNVTLQGNLGVTGSATIGTYSGTWNGNIITGTYGGTGVNNGSNTITLANNLTTAGNYALTLTTTAGTNVTLPTTGTLVNTAVTTLSSLNSIGTVSTGVWQGSTIGSTYGGTGVNNGSSTITIAGNLSISGAYTTALTVTAATSVTLPTTGSLLSDVSTNTLTHKTFDTAGTGNVLKIAGTQVTAIGGNTATLASASGTLTNGHLVSIDANGNFIDAGTASAIGATQILLGTVTASNSASVAFVNIPTGYDQYILRMTAVNPVTNGAYMQYVVGEGAGPTYITAGYGNTGTICGASGALNGVGPYTGGQSSWTMANGLGITNTAGTGYNGTILFTGLTSSFMYKSTLEQMSITASSSTIFTLFAGFNNNDTTPGTALKFYFNTGNINAGDFALYGVRLS